MKNNQFSKRAIALAVVAVCSSAAMAAAGDVLVSNGGAVPAGSALSSVSVSGADLVVSGAVTMDSGTGLTSSYGNNNMLLIDATDPLGTVKQVAVTINGISVVDGLGAQVNIGQGAGAGNISATGTVDAATVTAAYSGGSISIGNVTSPTAGTQSHRCHRAPSC